MKPLTDAKIIDSWSRNSAPWVEAVRGGEIESRILVTNDAIVEAVRARRARASTSAAAKAGWCAHWTASP